MGVIRGNRIYTFVDAPDWTSAERNANDIGGNLITINDKDEYIWAEKNFWSADNLESEGRAGNSWAYVGFNDKTSEGSYEWTSNESTSWVQLMDLIHHQNWYLQRQHLEGWDWNSEPQPKVE